MNNYQVKKGRHFDRDIEKIKVFLLSKECSKDTIEKYLNGIYESIILLKTNPKIGTSLNTKTSIPNNYRYIVSNQYLIFYKVFDNEKIVRIYRIFHGKENYLSKLELS